MLTNLFGTSPANLKKVIEVRDSSEGCKSDDDKKGIGIGIERSSDEKLRGGASVKKAEFVAFFHSRSIGRPEKLWTESG